MKMLQLSAVDDSMGNNTPCSWVTASLQHAFCVFQKDRGYIMPLFLEIFTQTSADILRAGSRFYLCS